MRWTGGGVQSPPHHPLLLLLLPQVDLKAHSESVPKHTFFFLTTGRKVQPLNCGDGFEAVSAELSPSGRWISAGGTDHQNTAR